MKRRRVVKILGFLVGAPIVVLTCLVAYLTLADLSGWRDAVSGILSQELGREVRIEGVFEPDLGLTSSLTVGDIALANAEWGSEPTMAAIEHLEVEIDILSLLFQPIRIHRIELDGVHVLLEVDGDGHANWEFETGGESEEDSEALELSLGQIDLRDAELVYHDFSDDQQIALSAAELGIRGDDSGMLDLEFDGQLNQTELALAARIGPLAGLLEARDVEHDLSGHLGDIEFSSSGHIADLTTLDGADLTAALRCSDFGAVAELFAGPVISTGPLTVDLRVNSGAEGFDLDFDASAGDNTAKVAGTVDSLTHPRRLDVTVEAFGPDISAVGALTGVDDLPDDAFAVSGSLVWQGFPVTFSGFQVSVGDNILFAEGTLGAPPQMMDSDFELRGEGPDISSLAALAGVALPRDPFSVSARIVRVEGGLEIDNAAARVGRATLSADGVLGDPPTYAGTAFTIHGEGPNLARFQGLAEAPLPAESFAFDGRLVRGEGAIVLEKTTARVGRNTLRVTGRLKTDEGLVGTRLDIEARGPNASRLARIAGLNDVPAEPWAVSGAIRLVPSGIDLDAMSANLGSLALRADGHVATESELVGTDLRLHIEDTDLAHSASLASTTGLPHEPFVIDGRIRLDDSGYLLDGIEVTVRDIALTAEGRVGALPDIEDSELIVAARGPRLSTLGVFVDQIELPSEPFELSGTVRVSSGAYHLDHVVISLGDNRVAVAGSLKPEENLVGTDLEIEITGPELRDLGSMVAKSLLLDLPDLPAEPFSLAGRVVIDDTGYELHEIEARLARAVAKIHGRVGDPPGFLGTDLTVDADGPNSSLLTSLTDLTVPAAPFQLEGRGLRTKEGFEFDSVSVRLGEYRAEVDGTLGDFPKLIGTELEISGSGPGLGLIADLTGRRELPNEPFEVRGRLEGTPERFIAKELRARLGASDLAGDIAVDMTGKPAVTAQISSKLLDLRAFARQQEEGRVEGTEDSSPAATPEDGLLFSDQAFDFAFLDNADADVRIRIGELFLPATQFSQVDLGLHLEAGKLEINRLSAIDKRQGTVTGNLVLEPADGAYRFSTRLALAGVHLELADSAVDPADQPPFDIEVDLGAQGRSPHELAAALTGKVEVVVGKGVMDNALFDLLIADILTELLTALNPFSGKEQATEFQCAVLGVTFENGHATLGPLAMQTDKMTMLGKGRIDLHTEKLDLEWVTKPRKGIGLSASMITNPYIKLGGTLSEPALQLKEFEAVRSTSVAVATFGLSLVAKGMFDRITAEKKVCKQALEELGREPQKR